MKVTAWAAPAASVSVYILLTAILGRDVLAQLASSIANDPGDPLLTAAILHWNAHHIPWSDAWWQFPIYYPTRDTLAFSEHLLGLSVIASPIAWLTGNPLVTYNLTMLLTFPLCGMAMYALVYRLTRSAAAAFIAGLAFAFAPYRMATLPHIQMLASFWAPLALLGLHEFVSGGRWQWLLLYAAAWALQGTANGYTLVFFSILVGIWLLWFVVAQRKWRALAMIATATAAAALPLLPILYKYASVHAERGFERGIGEMRAYSADVAAVLCAPASLTFWGWIRVACRGEGELFPGIALAALFVAALLLVFRVGPKDSPLAAKDFLASHRAVPSRPTLVWLRRVLLTIAAAYALIVATLLIVGPWAFQVGFINISASDVDKPLLVAIFAAVGALMLALVARATKPESTLSFYLLAAVVTWLLALGPTITLMGETSGRPGPFVLLQLLPGVGTLRVPARFWLMTVMCLTTAAGMFVAAVLKGRTRQTASVVVVSLAFALLADSWASPISARSIPESVPDPESLRGQIVLQLPIDPYLDVATTWRAVTGGWTVVNGYSGYGPNYYASLGLAAKSADGAMFRPFRRDNDLHVLVADDATIIKAMVERQPGAVRVAQRFGTTHYRLPRMAYRTASTGDRLRIAAVRSQCASDTIRHTFDDDEQTLWQCGEPPEAQELTIDLGRVMAVGSVDYSLGGYFWNVPGELAIATSIEGTAWTEARRGSVLGELIEGGLRNPRALRAALPFTPREARYVRLRPTAQAEESVWFVAELAVRAP